MTHHFRYAGLLVANALLLVTTTLVFSSATFAQTTRKAPTSAPDESPIFQEYRGVQIGWLADDVRKKFSARISKPNPTDRNTSSCAIRKPVTGCRTAAPRVTRQS